MEQPTTQQQPTSQPKPTSKPEKKRSHKKKPSLDEIFYKNLYRLRALRKLSQGKLAKAAGITVSYVSMLERGQRSPPLATIEALAKALGVSPVRLVSP